MQRLFGDFESSTIRLFQKISEATDYSASMQIEKFLEKFAPAVDGAGACEFLPIYIQCCAGELLRHNGTRQGAAAYPIRIRARRVQVTAGAADAVVAYIHKPPRIRRKQRGIYNLRRL